MNTIIILETDLCSY